ncbi:MAG: NADH-quinone oxidoreductase subunit L [Bacteroidetes bacterium GWD2_45_23]|nr:MAG: NADH-quinone oxidoreductase subunit L [Bacteroidetes bacterium GWC2_46_850]OFX86292.1 MAG: NADH-quinone oxidoreductase subunit L [Bacteroidetes bacterium GWD2_45_23]HBA99733.1 NADH-quinone oxidoreductase subunit L [Porphyromonadaceae bacterium]HCC17435.1 NADH-quinone oxidoreductase subunit L [Porphyromonadaceae bacterium]
MEYTLMILLLPLVSFVLLGLSGNKLSHKTSGMIGTGSLLMVALLSFYAAGEYFTTQKVDAIFQTLVPLNVPWLNMGANLHIDMGILLDPLSVMMLVVISTVSLMVHIYSLGYMKGEKGFQRYYAFLSLFTFSMLGLVLSTNIFQMYIFWELVGVSSYLLIGFYYTKPSAVAAAKKAFIVTRFADMFFLIGILVLSYYTQTFDFGTLTSGNGAVFQQAISTQFLGASALVWAMALIFIGGAGKSAMFPLHIWLPDAMEGPTPVSALIHAATMVVAGVYLVARLFPVYVLFTPQVLEGIAYVGAFTSMFAAVIAIVQTDIKRVLAFSTISQIGFMMVALGVSKFDGHEGLGYMASLFHLFTHAMFKALLFLGAGSVIHAVHSNEMENMGGLRKKMPITHLTFLTACLAIAGIPPFSGFFSKDEILSATYQYNTGLGIWMTLVAGLTAFYMFRLYYSIFWGKEKQHAHPLHESPKSMTFPLIFLAIPTLLGGFIPFGQLVTADRAPYTIHMDWLVAVISVVVALEAIFIASKLYQHPKKPATVPSGLKGFHKAASHRFYVDEVYLFVTKKILFNGISRAFAWFDRHVVDGFINGLATATDWFSIRIRGFQSGEIAWYAWVFLFGTLLITVLILFI